MGLTLRHFVYWVARYWCQLVSHAFIRLHVRNKLRCTRQFKVFLIDTPFCQLGNNVQQILIAWLHAERYGGSLSMSSAFYAHCQTIGINPRRIERYIPFEAIPDSAYVVSASFFHFTDHSFLRNPRLTAWKAGFSPRRCSLLREAEIRQGASFAASQCRDAFISLLEPALSSSMAVHQQPDTDCLILHLRAGDVSNLAKAEYATNPLCYYEALGKLFHRLVIVTQPGPEHVLLRAIPGFFESVQVVSGDFRDDFRFLENAETLATSGVSTFPIAAGLLSKRLQRLYASDAYLCEHLNPLFLQKQCEVCLFRMPGFLAQWITSRNRPALLHQYRAPALHFSYL